MRIGVVIFPGSNCDHDAYHVLKHVCGQEVRFVWHKDADLSGLDAVVLPGGFSYGDYLRAGAVAATSPVMAAVREAAGRGVPVLGICNGFQILAEAGLLPGVLLRNRRLRFICRDTWVHVESVRTPFTRGLREGEVLRMPVAHAEGRYFAPADGLHLLARSEQIVFRYCDSEGRVRAGANPNGAVQAIAGVCNQAGNVVGLMPHPERAGEGPLGSSDGRRLFESLLLVTAGVG